MSAEMTTAEDALVLSDREEGLVRSAYRVMAAKGGHRLSLQDIADEAGVSKGLILYHFKSKDRLFLTTMRWALERTARRIRERVGQVQDPREAITALLDAVFLSPQANRNFNLLYLDLIEHAARDQTFRELVRNTHGIINGLYAEVIQDGMDRGTFDVPDAGTAATQMRALIEGVFVTWLQDDWETTHGYYRQLCEDGLLRLLRAA